MSDLLVLVVGEQEPQVITITEIEQLVLVEDNAPGEISILEQAPAHGALPGLTEDDHPQYVTWVQLPERPVAPRDGTIWVPE